MKTATMSALRTRVTDYLNLTEPVVITQKGRGKAELWPVESKDDLEGLLLANNAEFMKLFYEADRRISETGGIPPRRLLGSGRAGSSFPFAPLPHTQSGR